MSVVCHDEMWTLLLRVVSSEGKRWQTDAFDVRRYNVHRRLSGTAALRIIIFPVVRSSCTTSRKAGYDYNIILLSQWYEHSKLFLHRRLWLLIRWPTFYFESKSSFNTQRLTQSQCRSMDAANVVTSGSKTQTATSSDLKQPFNLHPVAKRPMKTG